MLRLLLAITVLAFVALLWAAFSIAHHVRRARRRKRREVAAANELVALKGPLDLDRRERPAFVPQVSFAEPGSAVAAAQPTSDAPEAAGFAVEDGRADNLSPQFAQPAHAAEVVPGMPPAPLPQAAFADFPAHPLTRFEPARDPLFEPIYRPSQRESVPSVTESPGARVVVPPSDDLSPVAVVSSSAAAAVPLVPIYFAPTPSAATPSKATFVIEPDFVAPEPASPIAFREPASVEPAAPIAVDPIFEALISEVSIAAPEARGVEPQPVALDASKPVVSERFPPRAAVAASNPLAARASFEAGPSPETRGFPPARASTRHPLAALAARADRKDWAYFNKDLGDLSDPYEVRPSRIKDRAS